MFHMVSWLFRVIELKLCLESDFQMKTEGCGLKVCGLTEVLKVIYTYKKKQLPARFLSSCHSYRFISPVKL